MSQIKEFYSKIQFPGHYTKKQLEYHSPEIKNTYLKIIDSALQPNISVLDVGCGTGLITNLFADKYPTSNFMGIDFSDSVDYAIQYATQHNITNAQFIKQDFSTVEITQKYDVVICQGVLHHMPDYQANIVKLKSLVKENGLLVLGVYHRLGKLAKKWFTIDYKNNILHQDQELNPFETAFNFKEVTDLCYGFKFRAAMPAILNRFVAVPSLFNYKNGGLVTFIFQKQ